MADSSTKDSFCGGVSRFLDSPDLSDFTITCGGHKWPVHRFCLSLHSSVFDKACSSDFKEGQEKTYDLSEYSKDQVTALISYLYKFDYEATGEDHGQRMCFHVSMTILADKYDIPGLKKLATKKFKAIIEETKTAAELAEAATLAYRAETATSSICRTIARLVVKREAFMPGGAEGEVIEAVAQSYPQLALNIIKAMKETKTEANLAKDNLYRCPAPTCSKPVSITGCTGATKVCVYCQCRFPNESWFARPVTSS